MVQRAKSFSVGDALVGSLPTLLGIFAKKDIAEKQLAAREASAQATLDSDAALGSAIGQVETLTQKRAETASALSDYQTSVIDFERKVSSGEIAKDDEAGARAIMAAKSKFEAAREQAPLDAFKFDALYKTTVQKIRTSVPGIEARLPELLQHTRATVSSQQDLLNQQEAWKREQKVRGIYGNNATEMNRLAYAEQERTSRQAAANLEQGNRTFDGYVVNTKVISMNEENKLVASVNKDYEAKQFLGKEVEDSYIQRINATEQKVLTMLSKGMGDLQRAGTPTDMNRLNTEIDRTRERFDRVRTLVTDKSMSKMVKEYSETQELITTMGLGAKSDLLGKALMAGGPGVSTLVRGAIASGSAQSREKMRDLAEASGFDYDTAEGIEGFILEMTERITRKEDPIVGWTAMESYLSRKAVRNPAEINEIVTENALSSMSFLAKTPTDVGGNFRELQNDTWARKLQESSAGVQNKVKHHKRGWDTRTADAIADAQGAVVYDERQDAFIVTTAIGNSVRHGGVEIPVDKLKDKGKSLQSRRVNKSLTKLLNESYKLSTSGKYIGIFETPDEMRSTWLNLFGEQEQLPE